MEETKKAQKLVDKFRTAITSFLSDEMKDRNAIECAIIAVNEIYIEIIRLDKKFNLGLEGTKQYWERVLTHLNEMKG